MKVVFATDGSPGAHHAIREAARLLVLKDAQLYLVSAMSAAAAVAGSGGYGTPSSAAATLMVEEIEQAAARHFAAAEAVLAEFGLTATILERLGDPGAEILAVADEVQADLIVLGSHGYGPVKRLILGSVSDWVAHHAKGSIMIVSLEPGTEI